MRTFKTTSVVAIVLSLLSAASTFGAFGGTEYFDFSGWDHSQVTSAAGQTFSVSTPGFGSANVNVKGFGPFTGGSSWTASNFIQSGHLDAGDRNQLFFTFDTTLPIVIKAATVDQDEHIQVIGVGPEAYCHIGGLAPTQTAITSGLQIQGNGYGANAAQGEIITYAQQNQAVIVRHDSLAANKYEFFMIGTIVPEPNSAALLGVGAIGLLLSGRKRRRNS